MDTHTHTHKTVWPLDCEKKKRKKRRPQLSCAVVADAFASVVLVPRESVMTGRFGLYWHWHSVTLQLPAMGQSRSIIDSFYLLLVCSFLPFSNSVQTTRARDLFRFPFCLVHSRRLSVIRSSAWFPHIHPRHSPYTHTHTHTC